MLLVPIYVLVIGAFKPGPDVVRDPLGLSLDKLTLDNLDRVATDSSVSVVRAYVTTTIVTVCTVGLVIVLGAMMSYVIARQSKLVFRALYVLVVAGLMIPSQVILVPIVKVLQVLDLMFTLQGLILFNVGKLLPFAVFVYTGFIRTLPRSLDEAARIDGAGSLTTFWRIIFPLVKPATATVAILLSLWVWNDFVEPLIILGPGEGYTITTGMYRSIGQYIADFGEAFAWLWFAVIPVLVLFVVFQRQLVAGLTEGAVRE